MMTTVSDGTSDAARSAPIGFLRNINCVNSKTVDFKCIICILIVLSQLFNTFTTTISHKHQFYGVTRGFTRLSMHMPNSFAIVYGLISLNAGKRLTLISS